MKVLFKLLLILVFTWIPSQSFAVIDIIHFSKKDVSCPGANDGWLTVDSVTVSAPTAPPYVVRFTSNAGQTFAIGDTIFNLAQQTIIIRINDAGQIFPTNQSVDIDGPDPLLLDLAAIPATCFDTCNGQVFTQVQNGTPPYTYAWNTGSTSSSISGLCDGTYTVLVTDNNGCTISSSEVVTEPNDIIPNVTVTNVACNGDATGSATANAIDGVAPLTYSWSTGNSGASSTENGLVQGAYDVTVTDANGCQSIEAFTISEPPVLSSSISGSDPFCNGEASGFINVTVNGGSPAYTFTWDDIGVGPQNRTSLLSGTYTVTIEDDNGCTRQETQTLTEPTASTVTITGNNIACFGDATGDITVSVTGGTPGQTSFDWSNGSPTTTDNSDPYTSTINGLTEGKYYVTITNAAGCTKIDSLTLTEELELIPSFTNETNPSCNGGSDGSITASAVGGVAPYTFNWPGSPNTNPLSGLNAGSYTVTVVDANGCTKTLTSVLTQPDPIVPTLAPNDVSCNGGSDGSILASAVDGTPPYTFNWAGNPNTNPLTSLMAGTYTVTVVDAGGCTTTSSATISEPASGININLTASDVFCFGTATGGIINNTSGGTSPYTFAWSDGPTSQNRSNIVTGTYTVVVTDFNGCTETESIFVGTVPEIQITMSADSVSCNGLNDGKAWVTYNSGGINPVNNYSWSNGGNTDTISNLTAGRYFVTVSDVTGCAKVDSIDVGEPDQLTIDPPITTDPLCNNSTDGTITINVTGGTPGYAFIWNDNDVNQNRTGLGFGNYSVTVTDKNGCTNSVATTLNNPTLLTVSIDSSKNVSCNGLTDGFARALASGGTTPYTYAWQGGPNNASNPSLAAGTYTVIVTDNNGCTATTSQIITEPNAILANASIVQNAQCDGLDNGEVTANATGGTAPYTYFWNPGNINSQTISGLAGGTYTVTVTDGNGCTDEQTLNVSQPSAIAFTTDNTDLNCTGDNSGTASVINPQGGTAPYTYLWTPGGSTSQTATGLSAQAYTVLVTDNNGCTNTGSVNISEPTVLSATITNSTNPTCNGINDGTASVTGSGGTVAADYTYLWSPDGETTASITNKAAGTYTVVITDNNGCTDSDQVTLTAPTGVIISDPADTLANVLCVGGNNGYIGVSATGGVQPYTFDWDNIAGTNDGAINANLIAGTYNLTVTDNNGCFETESYTITEPTVPFTVSITEVKKPCSGASDGVLTVTESNGTAPYTYNWTGTTQTTDTVRNLGPGFYLVNVIDANGCAANANFTLTPSTPIVGFTTSTITNVDCFGDSTGSAGAIAFGGTGNLTFTWSTGDVTGSPSVITTLKAGTYTVTVNDENSCTDSQSITITEPNELDPNTTAINVSCAGTADGSISSTPIGGTSPYSFVWSTGTNSLGVSSAIINLAPNTYTLTVTDANDCDTVETFVIIKDIVNYTFRDSVVNESCDLACDGYIEIKDLVGGIAPITYTWLDGSTGPVRSNLCPGNYTVTISDGNSCDTVQNYTITPGTVILANLTTNDASCGQANGFATTTPSGGVAPYTFNWDPATGTAVSTGNVGISSSLAPGNYDVTISDGTCSIIQPFSIGTVPSFTFDTATINVIGCFGDCTGDISIANLAGGTAPYTYTWNGVPGTNILANLCAGTYNLNISDDAGCDTNVVFNITQPLLLEPNITLTSAGCPAGSTGSATSTPVGGTAPYTFDWSNGTNSTGNSGTVNLLPGNYSLTVTDASMCDSVEFFTILKDAGSYTFRDSVVNESCDLACDGFIEIKNLVGGVAPVTYTWSDGSIGAIRSNLCPGNYTVTISDANNCDSIQNYTITPGIIIAPNLVTNNANCGANNGFATVTPTGGVAPYTFSWDPATGTAVSTGITGISSSLAGGNYDVTINDATCSTVVPFTIGSAAGFTFDTTVTNSNDCFGDCNSSIAISNLAGGTAPYTFTWNGVSGANNIQNLCAGTYNLNIADNTGCDTNLVFSITQPALLEPNITLTSAGCPAGSTGSATSTPIGGTAPFQFEWSTGLITNGNTGSLNELPGTYSLTVTDANGCDSVETFTILKDAGSYTFRDSVVNESCDLACDGFIEIKDLAGGFPPYIYAWADGSVGPIRSNLCPGNYTVTISDGNNCDSIQNYTITPGIIIAPNLSTTNASCGANDGFATVTPAGGVAPYTFSWDPNTGTAVSTGSIGISSSLAGGNYDVTINDATCSTVVPFTIGSVASFTFDTTVTNINTCFGDCNSSIAISNLTGGTTPYTFTWNGTPGANNIQNLCAGNYTLNIADQGGCDTTISFTITEPNELNPNLVVVNANCSGATNGTATSTPSGGSAPYDFEWSTGLIQTAQLTSAISEPVGNYSLTVTDANGCDSIEVFSISGGTAIILSSSSVSDTCINSVGRAEITSVTGGTTPYTFIWPGNISTTAIANNVAAGTYDVTVEDNSGCQKVESIVVPNFSTFTINAIVDSVSCKNGSDGEIFINTVGGVNPVTYNWAGGITGGATPKNLTAGTYELTVTDFAGCSEIAMIDVEEPDSLTLNISPTLESCAPGNDAVATAFALGGTPSYSYTWSAGVPSGNTTTGLTAGFYTATVNDKNGCEAIGFFDVFSDAPFSVSTNTTKATCNGGTDGTIILTITGFAPPLTYSWDNGLPPDSTQNNLGAGTYRVTITDASTCSRQAAITIIEESPIAISVVSTDESCSPGNDAYALASVIGGVEPYTYAWSSGTPFNDSVADLSEGAYNITVTDANGCTEVEAFTVFSGSDLDGGAVITDATCFGLCDGVIELFPTGGSGSGYTYAWDNGNTTNKRENLCLGAYRVTITDNSVPPCTRVENLFVTSPSDLTATTFVGGRRESCVPGNDGGITFFANGGTAPYTLQTSAGNVNGLLVTGLTSGNYLATVTDANGCSLNRPFEILKADPAVITSSFTDAPCNGVNGGSITINAAGGTNPYTYNWTGGLAGNNPGSVGAGTYTVTVADGKGCEAIETVTVGEATKIQANFTIVGESCNPGSDGSATANVTGGTGPYNFDWGAGSTTDNFNIGLTAGNYTVTITDAIGCTEAIPYIINNDAPFNLDSIVNQITCNGANDGSISLSVTGNSGTISYLWDNSSVNNSRSSLGGGVYGVTVTDAGTGCTETANFILREPSIITISSIVTEESCRPGNDGTIALTPSGGTTANPGIYTYNWVGLPANANQVGLSAGTYDVTVFDDNGCSATESIIVNPSAPFNLDLDSTDVSCFGLTDGRITVNTTASNPTYQWDNGLLPRPVQNNLASGTFCVTVTDDKGCTETDCITINEPSDITGTVNTTPESCAPGNDGTASVSASGGTVSSPANYIFSWSTGATGSSISGLSSGSYDVTILDENGCDEVVAFNVGSVAPYTVDLDSTDVSCNGLSDGTITLNTTAINPTFNWNTTSNQNDKDQNNLAAGTYEVTVTEPSTGCTETANITINEPSILSATIATTPANCNPGNDGTASATGNGGTAPYTFNWSTGETNVNSIGTLTSGNYDVTVVDANGCTQVEIYTIGSSAPFTVSLDSTDITCNGLQNGTINLTTSAINPTFLWNDGSINQNRTNLFAGTYTVVVTEPSSGCSESVTTTINQPSPINITVNTFPESCSPGSDGSASALVSGGTSGSGNYQIDWPNSQTGSSVSGLVAGNYSVTVTDDNGCTEVEPFTIGSVAPFVLDLDSTDVSCNGLSDGSVTVITSANNPLYVWSGGLPSSPIQNNLPAGTYSVTVIESSTGCRETKSIVVNEPSLIVATINTSPESCNPGGDGSANATAIGGAGSYTFDWSSGDLNTSSVNSLSSGSYFITVTDVTGCSVIQNFNVGSTAPFSVDLDSTDVSCNGLSDGTITLTTTAVNPTFLWSNGSSAQNQANLLAGTYDVTVTEPSSGCSETKSIVVNEPTAVSVRVGITNETCAGNDGTATAIGSGGTSGTGVYSFNWSDGQSTATAINLTAGSYLVTVTDDNGCTAIETVSIGTDAPFDVILDSTNISCNGLADGTITLTTTAVNPTFLWSNGSINQNLSGLTAGTYSVVVTEPSSGCSETQNINIVEPSAISLNIVKTDNGCQSAFSGTATVFPSGGTVQSDYGYLWNTGETIAAIQNLAAITYTVTVTDDNGCDASSSIKINKATKVQPNEIVSNETCNGACDGSIVLNPSNGSGNYSYLWNTGQTTRTRTGLCGGNYLVTISDGLSCDTVVSFNINSNFPLVNTIATTDQGCSSLTVCDGGAVVTSTGGLAPYTYDWPMGTVTGITSDTAKALCKGNYSVTITDASGCSSVEPFIIGGPDPITATFVTIDPTCNISDGQITVTASGGSSASYSYQWFDVSNNPLAASDTLKNVTAGVYFVDITDNAGCTFRFSTSLSDLGSEIVTVNATDASCFNTCDGSAIASFNCQDPNCTIEWVDAATGNTISSGTSNIDKLCSGDYFVKVTNNSGCISIDPFTIGSPDEFQITANITDVSCNLGFDGAISINVSGGSGIYSYNWSPGPITGQSTSSVSGLTAGTYNVTVSDVNLCDTVLNFQVGEPTEIMATFSSVDANCNQSNGQIIANVTGGTIIFDYDYQWFDGLSNPIVGQTSPNITGLSAGNYFLRVRDANSCEKVFISTVGSTNGPTIVIDSVRDLTCFDDNTGAIFTTASGANSPFTYNWLPQGQTNSDAINLTAGTYTIGVTNSLGCTTFDTVTVNGPSELLATLNISEASCGLCNGEARITPSGGTAPYTYLWSNGSTADSAMSLCGGSYSMVLSDASGCSKSFNFSVNTNGGPTGETVTVSNASCASNCDGSATVTPIGGIAPYTYLWLHNGATSNSLTNLCPGNYTLQVSDVKGCSRSVNIDILSPAAMSLTSTITAQTCNSIPCDGSIRIDMSGGTSPYTYNWGPGSLPATSNQTGLCAGIYNLTVTDANGCSLERDLTLNNTGVPLSVTPTVEDVNCYGSCDGSLISNITILTDYNFQWFNSQGTAISPINGDLTNSVCAGDYFLEITSLVSGCKSFENVTVGEPDSISLASSIVRNISCNGACDGEIFVSTIGGNILYQYSWDDPNGQDGVPAKDLCAGTYGVTATDANGCSETTSVTLVDPPVLNLSIDNFTNVGCSSDCEGTANVSGTGGTTPYTFEWSGGQTGDNPTDLCFGQNIITLTDATGCSIMDTINISAVDTVLAIVPNQKLYCGAELINLKGESQGSSVNSVAWYIGDASTFFTSNLDTNISRPFGNYTFFLIASNGSCSDTTEFSFEVAPEPFVGLAPSIAIFKDEIALFRLSNQSQSYSYSWSPGSFLNDSNIAEPLASPRENIVYTVTVTDTTGCTYSDSIKVLYTKDIEIPSGISPNGDGVNDTWEIDFLEDFPNASVLIYNRWGTLLYEQNNGYKATWDGTYEGKALPIGTYYYVIDLKSDRFEPLTGPITIVK